MEYSPPKFPKSTVDLAGRAISGDAAAKQLLRGDRLQQVEVVNNWRAAHVHPLNVFYLTLRNRTKLIDNKGLVAQRIKRFSSIEGKLSRLSWLILSKMQEIAGCRSIVSSIDNVSELVESYKRGYSTHNLVSENDYIRSPKRDGYRSHHLVFEYNSLKMPQYKGLKVEFQIRTQLQHCWATAVETADTFYKQGLKAHQGSPEWRRFFALMGAAIAISEGEKSVPHTPRDWNKLIDELRKYSRKLDVQTRLGLFGQVLDIAGDEQTRRVGIKYLILVLDPEEGTENLKLFGFLSNQYDDAVARYEEIEQDSPPNTDVVMVSVSDASNLRQAYPNYYLDTTMFLNTLSSYID